MPDENLQVLLAEMDAQRTALLAVEATEGGREAASLEARLAVEKALELAEPAGDFLGRMVLLAMKAVLGQDPSLEGAPKTDPSEDHEARLSEAVALLWVDLLPSRRTKAPESFSHEANRIRQELQAREDQNHEGAVHRMALLLWLDALQKLQEDDPEAARRLWKRSLEVGASFGTMSHPVVLWSYIASFFPTS